MQATTVCLKHFVPEGVPTPKDFEMKQSVVPKTVTDGQLLVQILCMSPDPYLRNRIKSEANAAGNAGPGMPMTGFVSGQVIESKHPDWKTGDLFGASLPYSTVQIVDLSSPGVLIWPLKSIGIDQISLGVGCLGMPGATAYGGLIDILACNKGETIWVSAAAGAVGSMVGMLAKNVFGCKVIGSAGGPEKCKMVVEKFGFDACVDYREAKGDTKKLVAMVKEVAPEGIDTYFDNVGGFHFEAATAVLRSAGRIALCGAIAAYNDAVPLPANLYTMKMIYTGQRIEGFVCLPWLTGKRGAFYKEMPKWVSEGKIVVEETRFKGVENWAVGFQALFEGKNTGKVVVDIAPAVQIKASSSSSSSSRSSSKSASKRSSKRSSTKTKSRDE